MNCACVSFFAIAHLCMVYHTRVTTLKRIRQKKGKATTARAPITSCPITPNENTPPLRARSQGWSCQKRSEITHTLVPADDEGVSAGVVHLRG